MSNLTTVSSSRYFSTYCSPMILRELIHLSRGGQRLLLILLSKLSINKNNYRNRSVRLTFGEYCAAIQQPYDNTLVHGVIRNAFYDLKNHCGFVVAEDCKYYEGIQTVIIVFSEDFYAKMREMSSIMIPMALIAVERGRKMPNYPLTMAIYYRKHVSGKNKVTLSIPEIIKLCGGVHTDFENKQKNWRIIYAKKISNALSTIKDQGFIAAYRYKLDNEEAIDPNDYDNYLDDDTRKSEKLCRLRILEDNYNKMTKHYRTYLDVNVVITFGMK